MAEFELTQAIITEGADTLDTANDPHLTKTVGFAYPEQALTEVLQLQLALDCVTDKRVRVMGMLNVLLVAADTVHTDWSRALDGAESSAAEALLARSHSLGHEDGSAADLLEIASDIGDKVEEIEELIRPLLAPIKELMRLHGVLEVGAEKLAENTAQTAAAARSFVASLAVGDSVE